MNHGPRKSPLLPLKFFFSEKKKSFTLMIANPASVPAVSLEAMAKRTIHRYRKPISHKLFPLVRAGDVRQLHLLLHSDANWMGLQKLLSIRDGFGNTAIIVAASEGNSAMIDYLLLQTEGEAADINAINKQGMTALHWAANSNHPKIIDLLLQKKANLFQRTTQGRTALDLALQACHEPAVSTLLLWGCPFPPYILGRYGATCVEQERNLIVAKCGSTHYQDCRPEMISLWRSRIAPAMQ
jgi:hypothetical protein